MLLCDICCYDVLVCPDERWGPNCENLCRCEESCDKVVGCTSCDDLYPGWTGANCDQDIDECQNITFPACGANADCTNLNGSFACDCHTWYHRVSDRCDCKCSTSYASCNKTFIYGECFLPTLPSISLLYFPSLHPLLLSFHHSKRPLICS